MAESDSGGELHKRVCHHISEFALHAKTLCWRMKQVSQDSTRRLDPNIDDVSWVVEPDTLQKLASSIAEDKDLIEMNRNCDKVFWRAYWTVASSLTEAASFIHGRASGFDTADFGAIWMCKRSGLQEVLARLRALLEEIDDLSTFKHETDKYTKDMLETYREAREIGVKVYDNASKNGNNESEKDDSMATTLLQSTSVVFLCHFDYEHVLRHLQTLQALVIRQCYASFVAELKAAYDSLDGIHKAAKDLAKVRMRRKQMEVYGYADESESEDDDSENSNAWAVRRVEEPEMSDAF